MHLAKMSPLVLAALIGSLAAAPPLLAQGSKDNTWENKQWRSHTESAGKRKLCRTMTGGDGDHSFAVQVEGGGYNAWFYFQEQINRGGKPILQKDDEIVLKLEGRKTVVYDYDVSVMLGITRGGIPEAKAAMPGGYSPEFIRNMRASDSLTVLRINPRSKKQEVLHKFSLDGFTANYLKLSEWCKFNPDKLVQS